MATQQDVSIRGPPRLRSKSLPVTVIFHVKWNAVRVNQARPFVCNKVSGAGRAMSATTASHCWPRLSIQRCTHKFSSLAFLIVEESKKPAQACLKPYKRKLSVGAPRVVIVGRASVEVDVAAAECQRVPLPASGNIRRRAGNFDTCSPTTIMSRLPRRPTRTHARRVAASIPLLIVAFLALILLCPVNVKAQDDKSEYGTVIGIGEWWLALSRRLAAADGQP